MNNFPRLMLAAPSSGAGKTLVTTALLAALAARGKRAAAFKCGPDFVDPLFHREILGIPGGNLDLFFSSPEGVRGVFCRAAAGADISIIEGAMGYYDGIGTGDRASAWRVAAETRTPVVLVVRPKGACLTVAAVIAGLVRFRGESGIRGVILNRCGEAFAERLAPVIERETGLRVYGHLPEMAEAAVAERHLGLALPDSPEALAALRSRVDALAERAARSVDLDGLLELAAGAGALDGAGALPEVVPVAGGSGRSVRIAVARDAAFCFYYQENFDLLRALGADLVFFSPLRDARLPDGFCALYFGGGYPELHAAALAGNVSLRGEVRRAVAGGMPTLAEGGGFLYLQGGLVDVSGVEREMVGALPGVGKNAGGVGKRFGYITLRARSDNLLLGAGEEISGHEFHYWESDCAGDACVAVKASGGCSWECVVAGGSLFAGFPHVSFLSNPGAARRFVEAAAGFRG